MFKILDEVCKPTKGSKYSAAIDLYSREDVVIGAGETVKVPLGVCIDSVFFIYEIGNINVASNGEIKSDEDSNEKINFFLKSHYLQLEPRSSLRAKGLIAGTGIIDLDYKNEIMIILHNPVWQTRLCDKSNIDKEKTIVHFGATTNLCYKISKGDKIAQILLKEHKSYLMGVESDAVRVSGFGSTGK